MSISRVDAIKMSGDVSKHNYLRAISVAIKLQKILGESGVTISTEQALLALPDFYERVHDDILAYHFSHVCEFLNNIRWAIRTYLRPEFNRSYYLDECRNKILGEEFLYGYKVPENIKSRYARNCYWDLMNKLRTNPSIRRFIVSRHFKIGI